MSVRALTLCALPAPPAVGVRAAGFALGRQIV
jgi:hypothetical protein